MSENIFENKRKSVRTFSKNIYIFEKDIVKELPDIGDHETTTFTRLVQTGQLLGVKSTELWIGIDSFVELREVENYLCSISK